jgi:hypothetical protein
MFGTKRLSGEVKALRHEVWLLNQELTNLRIRARLADHDETLRVLTHHTSAQRVEGNQLHSLINNLATVLGLKRNVHTQHSVCPDQWIQEDTEMKEPMNMVQEPTGRLREAD